LRSEIAFAPFFHFHYFFDRNQDLAEPIRHA